MTRLLQVLPCRLPELTYHYAPDACLVRLVGPALPTARYQVRATLYRFPNGQVLPIHRNSDFTVIGRGEDIEEALATAIGWTASQDHPRATR